MGSFCIAVRDDDTSFWTAPWELETLYGKFFKKGLKLSLAVIPYAWRQVNAGVESEFFIDVNSGRRFIYENGSLVDYLKEKLREGKIEIMQHGYDHAYGVYLEEKKKEFLTKDVREYMRVTGVRNYKYLPECIFKSVEELKNDLRLGKEILEDTFQVKVRTFVPPGNALSKEAVKIIADLGMNISGIIERKFNRPLSVRSVMNYVKRIIWKMRYNRPYPFVMNYGTHKELVAYAFTPSSNYEGLIEALNFCRRKRAPFVLATHYWEVLRDGKLRKKFFSFLGELEVDRVLLLYQVISGSS